jgi:hypothetical protein
MSIFADAYSRYLTNSFNYLYKYQDFQKLFKRTVVSITEPNFISRELIDNLSSFPKYPDFFKIISKTDNLNLVKIYNTTLDHTDNLIDSVRNFDILNYKTLYDSIPITITDLVLENNIQFSFINNYNDLYDYDKVINSFISDSSYRNFFGELYTSLFCGSIELEETSGLESGSFFYQYLMYCILYNTLSNSHNILYKLISYINQINLYEPVSSRVDSFRQVLDFTDFIDSYSSVITTDISKSVVKSIYKFQNVSTLLISQLNTVINEKLNTFSTVFETFLNNTMINYSEILSSYFTYHLNAALSVDVLSQVYDNDNIVDQTSSDQQTLYEEDQLSNYLDKMTENNLKNYLFLAFLYKFWPIKFLNVIQLVLKQYTEDLIKTPDDDLFTTADYYTTIIKLFFDNHLNVENLFTFLDENITPQSEIIEYQTELEVGVEFENDIEFDDPDTEFEPDIEFEPRIEFELGLGRYTFTPLSNVVECYDINSFNAVNVGDYIYAYGDDRTNAVHVVSKNLETLVLNLEFEYDGNISEENVLAYIYKFSTFTVFTDLNDNRFLSKFAANMFNIRLLDTFFASTYYITFVEELTENIFIYLRDNGHIDYNYNWYDYHKVIDIYFRSFLRWKLVDVSKRVVLSNYKNAGYKFEFNESIVYCLNKSSYDIISNGDFIFSETDSVKFAKQVISHEIVENNYILNLSAPYEGTSTLSASYESAYTYTSSDLPLFSIFSNNFDTIVSNLITNTTNNPLYDIYFKIPSVSQINSNITFLMSSSIYNIGMHRFTENLILSTITREVIYSVLSDFVI